MMMRLKLHKKVENICMRLSRKKIEFIKEAFVCRGHNDLSYRNIH